MAVQNHGQNMELSKKHLTAIFTFAAGIGFGAVTGIANLLPQDEQNSKPAQNSVQTTSDRPPAPAYTLDATVTKVHGENVFHARVHTWVAQFAMISVCPKNKTTAPQGCDFEATVAEGKIATGENIKLSSLTAISAKTSASAPTADLPDIRPRQDIVPGPVSAKVVKLVDGDTVQVIAETFPHHYALIDIRVGEIDTPEKKGRAKCTAESALAEKASAATEQLVLGRKVFLYNVQFEKYGGRVLGDIRTPEGISVAQNLIEKNLARPYDGGKKQSWCP